MMPLLRNLLFPISILYGLITNIRNLLYNKNILKSKTFSIPIITVGNLSVGGTGKTPLIEYLITLLIKQYSIATLSRGYKRNTKGFIEANKNSTPETIGDEPYQFFKKFKEVTVAVDANRREGIKQLLTNKPSLEVILLDDAFQHRKVSAGLNIVLTAYTRLFYNDTMLPTGDLREYRSNIQRADIVIVTKCPKEISEQEMNKIEQNIQKYFTKTNCIYFSTIEYDNKVYNKEKAITLSAFINDSFICVAGIANPFPFFEHLNSRKEDQLQYPDHHEFSNHDIQHILNKAKGRKIITTEKDYVRLKNKWPNNELFYLPIKIRIIKNESLFTNKILDYVGKNTTNR